MSITMSYSMTEDLIDLVLRQPELIDPTHLDYRNIAKRDKIWENLGERLGTSGEDVKKKWRSLRDTYARVVKRKRQFSGQGKFKKWLWADKMEPLRHHMAVSNDSDYPDPSPDTDGDYGYDNTNDTANDDQKATSSENFLLDPIVPEVMLATTSTPTSGPKRKFTEPPSTSVDWGYFEEDRRRRMDHVDLLFLAHAGTVKTFSAKRQALAKLQIAQVIMEQELLHQEEITHEN